MIKKIIKNLSNIPGWRTDRKIIVFESDDWGSIRMPSLRTYKALKDRGINIDSGDNKRFNTLDTLANVEDFEALFNTLSAFKDKQDNHPIMTAMALSANPDFDKIKADEFKNYHYQAFTDTLKQYQQEDAFAYWKKGHSEKLFIPEFHGREHLDIKLWMKALQAQDKSTLVAFQFKFWGFRPKNLGGLTYQAAFNLHNPAHIAFQQEIIHSGVKLFEHLHGRKPSFFVPPNGAIHQSIINTAAKAGMNTLRTPREW
jgi:hypothetical protein